MTISATKKRLIKRLGLSVSELGFGAWGIGGENVGHTSPIEGRETVLAYLEAGGNFIDTAASYGESEEILGRTLREYGERDSICIATKSKMGETADTVTNIRAEVERSLVRLGRDCLDIFYLHFPPEDDTVITDALGVCETLRREGKIRGIGASVKGPAVTDLTVALAKKYVDTGAVDVLQLVYSILRQKNIEAIEYAESHDVAVVARTVMESGFLTGKYKPGIRFSPDDHRARWNGSVDRILEAAERLRTVLPACYQNLGQLAVKFSLVPSGVCSVIAGAKNARQMRDNLRIASLPDLVPGTRQILIDEFGGFTESANPLE